MPRKGKLIVIEGTDGSGKGTQTNLLEKYLRQNHNKVHIADFPRYETFFGKIVGRYLNGEFGDVHEVSPYLASLTYALDRSQLASKIKDWLAKGDFVIANRYGFSNLAYQGAKLSPAQRKKFMAWNNELEYKHFCLPKEDLVIFLYLPSHIGQTLVDKKQTRSYTKNTRDIHERNSAYLQEVEKQYLSLSRTLPYVSRIDCLDKQQNLRLIEQIHQDIINILNSKHYI